MKYLASLIDQVLHFRQHFIAHFFLHTLKQTTTTQFTLPGLFSSSTSAGRCGGGNDAIMNYKLNKNEMNKNGVQETLLFSELQKFSDF